MSSEEGTQNPETLAILDVETSEVKSHCIPGNPSGIGAPVPIWSPTSQQLVLVNTSEDKNHNRVILVDIVDEYAVQIAENMMPKGWLTQQR